MSHERVVQQPQSIFSFVLNNRVTERQLLQWVRQGGNLLELTEDGQTIFHRLSELGDVQKMQTLLEMMNTLSLEGIQNVSKNTDMLGFFLGHIAAQYEYKLSLLASAMLQVKDNKGRIPLHIAARNGHLECVKLLSKRGFGIYHKDNSGSTPLGLAANGGHVEAVRHLHNQGTALHDDYAITPQPIHLAAKGGDEETMNYLISHGEPWHRRDQARLLASCYAAANGHTHLLQLLKDKGDPLTGYGLRDNEMSLGVESPMKYAAMFGELDSIRFLLEQGVPIDSLDSKQLSPLYYAAQNQQLEAFELLVEAGADFQTINDKGQSLFDIIEDKEWCRDFCERYQFSHDKSAFDYSCLCYMSSFSHPDYTNKLGNEQSTFENARNHLRQQGWIRYCDSESVGKENRQVREGAAKHGYYGISYYRNDGESGVELVIAHRGTCFELNGNVLADVEILEGQRPKMLDEATLPFVNAIANLNNPRPLKIDDKPVNKVTHVGFSLGGFLAGACAVEANHRKVHACTFDAPGYDFLAEENPRCARRIKNYMVEPNLVNTTNAHLGRKSHISLRRVGETPQGMVDCDFEILNLNLFHHLIMTHRSHNLHRIVSTYLKSKQIVCRQVEQWPSANNDVIRGPASAIWDKPYWRTTNNSLIQGIELFGQVAAREIATEGWTRTRRRNENGIIEGIIKLEHQCDYTIRYPAVEVALADENDRELQF